MKMSSTKVDRRTIIDETLISHAAFENATARLQQCFDYAGVGSEPMCIPIIGESRTGKSRLLEEFVAAHPQRRTAEGQEIPILRVKTPSKPVISSLVEKMLLAMGDPAFSKGRETDKTNRLLTLLKNARTRMIMVDEFQHVHVRGTRTVQHFVADWLKNLVDDEERKYALVVAGLPPSLAVLEQNEQLAGRFLAPIQMPRFLWSSAEHRAEFEGILAAFDDVIREHFDLPQLDSEEMAFRCYCATGGLIGYLAKFLRQAVLDAETAKRRVITLDHIAEAHAATVWSKVGRSDLEAPFGRHFQVSPSRELLAKVRAIGTPVVPEAPPRRKRKQARTSVHNVLSAR